MITAAKTASQIGTHAAIAFGLMYAMTGSIAFGGLAAIAEPVINVLLLPLHERAWRAIQGKHAGRLQALAALAGEKFSQTALHMVVAFLVMYWATGSAVSGGLMAVLEPVCNVIVLPFHNRLWERLRTHLARTAARPGPLAAGA